MNRKLILFASLAVSATLLGGASDPANFAAWPAGQLTALINSLPSKLNDQKYALENLGNFQSHYVLMVHREGDGPAELHDLDTDFYVVQKGEGTLILGGEIQGGKTTAPGEIRGQSIRGGKRIKLNAGDVLNIPHATPHQVVLEPGQKISYLIVKIRSGS